MVAHGRVPGDGRPEIVLQGIGPGREGGVLGLEAQLGIVPRVEDELVRPGGHKGLEAGGGTVSPGEEIEAEAPAGTEEAWDRQEEGETEPGPGSAPGLKETPPR